VTVVDQLQQGRRAYRNRAWRAAHQALSEADQATPLPAEDLELLATSAYMLGRGDEYVAGLERALRAFLERGEELRAARCAFWIGIDLCLRGQTRASGWFGRARRLVERQPGDCVERGYLLLAQMFEVEAAGDLEGATAAAREATAAGARFGDADLFALAAQDQGILLIAQGRVGQGLKLLDEAMVAVTAGELSPIVNGFVYCGVIMGCRAAYEPRRAREWTAALTRWCERQPDLVSFTGACLVHRAEIMQLRGDWRGALNEARRAGVRCAEAMNRSAAAQALYREGELHRLQGDFDAAEAAYTAARRSGTEPQPGLALLRLSQGNASAAAAAIRRLLDETTEPAKRVALLPAGVEIMLAAGDPESARRDCAELRELADRWQGGMVDALAAHALGAVRLHDGDARAALVALRRAALAWQELDAPYEAARTRVLVGLACRAVGDDDTAAQELDAARDVFAQLGAAPDLERLGELADPPDPHGLSPRELEVLRLVAAGRSNREIGATLVISEHTVARHLQNIFAKLGVSSRTAATAFAFAHDLLRGQN
jgi:DNA-binding CsgD family transcriptional regulator